MLSPDCAALSANPKEVWTPESNLRTSIEPVTSEAVRS